MCLGCCPDDNFEGNVRLFIFDKLLVLVLAAFT